MKFLLNLGLALSALSACQAEPAGKSNEQGLRRIVPRAWDDYFQKLFIKQEQKKPLWDRTCQAVCCSTYKEPLNPTDYLASKMSYLNYCESSKNQGVRVDLGHNGTVQVWGCPKDRKTSQCDRNGFELAEKAMDGACGKGRSAVFISNEKNRIYGRSNEFERTVCDELYPIGS
ncbi:hypothetical protein G7046_g4286 [Stylonectria norvegica]|nr:hypothetical protein G7046_g4286 [Stylonectria norvegica]